ncbi:MAG: GNAT family N-acetyltransferase [Sphingobacteriales bacterium]|nr:MAG: GNAT family N-acetyltransferase [Sphingobacteriales bacterium]
MTEISFATGDDAPLIRQLAVATWWITYREILSPEQIEYMLQAIYDTALLRHQIESGEQRYILISEDGVPQGFASFGPRKENTEIFKLHKLYCLPATQGNGFGKALLQFVEDEVKKVCNTLDLNVNKYNTARNFYEKMGYRVVYEEDIPIGEYWMNDFVMRKEL